jgi:hypothetical protein
MGPKEQSCSLARDLIVAGAALVVPLLTLLSGTSVFVPPASLPALIIIPALFLRGPSAPPMPDDSDDDDGPGGSRKPDGPKGLPGGGLPLPDAIQSSRRYRGTPHATLIDRRDRRPSREPERPRVPHRVYRGPSRAA